MRLLGLFFTSMFSMVAFTMLAQAAPGSGGPGLQLVSCGNGVLELGEDCDDGNIAPGDCCAPTCQFESTSTECRAAAGVCDAPDNCDGAGACEPDAKLVSECRPAAGACDVAEFCDGVSDDCPQDLFAPAGTECHAGSGVCDPAWFCDGVSPDCTPLIPTWEIVCRASAGPCDAEELCDVNGNCPADEKLTTVCRPAVHICDAAEFCDGVSDSCPIVDLPANGLACPDGDLCNGDEICVGWVCTPGVPLVCDDEDICTTDSCDPLLGCINEFAHEPPCVDNWLPSASPTGRLLLSLLLVAAGATFLARRGRFGA